MVETKSNTNAGARSDASRSAIYPGVDDGALGKPEYDRRLSDKILAAFNHAYASGAHKVAERLRNVLADVELVERDKHNRRADSAVSQADLWIGFIEARNGYNALISAKDAPPQDVEGALESMKESYRVWADS